jgi:hypothetical protein
MGTQSRLITTRSRVGDAVTTRHDSPEGGRKSHDSLEAISAQKTQSRLARGRATQSHSPEANPGWETQLPLARGHP